MPNIVVPREYRPRLPAEPLKRLLALLSTESGGGLSQSLRGASTSAAVGNAPWRDKEQAVLLVLADLASLGWQFKVRRGVIYMLPKSLRDVGNRAAKEMLRRSLLEARDAQLREDSTRSFLTSMHRPRPHKGREVSIENLIEDGTDLARNLREHRGDDLGRVVQPYIQHVDSFQRCEWTGLNLMDVWRYFRHTWSLIYRPTPGRTINFLIRNAARPDHPVIGIIGLANAVFQLSVRDNWIGWTSESLVETVEREQGHWSLFRQQAIACLRQARETIRTDDLFEEIGGADDPAQAIRRLETLAFAQGKVRKEELKAEFEADEKMSAKIARKIPRLPSGEPDWRAASESPLFKRKRAEVVADIMFAESVLGSMRSEAGELLDHVRWVPDGKGGKRLRWLDPTVERACKGALREIKKNGVATRILDVNVCGAAPGYREILGGKLAAMALFSEEVQAAYCARYSHAPSEIASAMAGRAITKPTRISILTTTSLYGVGSSQYNRVRMPWGDSVLGWERIGETEGFGTVHMTRQTIDAVRAVAVSTQGMRTVNNRFGEGTSPLLRQLREGLTMLGFESDDVLRHSNNRIVYALELHPQARRNLALDMDNSSSNPPMAEIARIWTDRWLSMRIWNDAVLDRTAAYSVESVKRIIGLSGVAPEDDGNRESAFAHGF
jgi:hypothetical protein